MSNSGNGGRSKAPIIDDLEAHLMGADYGAEVLDHLLAGWEVELRNPETGESRRLILEDNCVLILVSARH